MKELSKKKGSYTDYAKDYYGLHIHRYDIRHENFTSQHLGLKKSSGSVLDVGCGDGFWSNMLAKYYDKVTGVDISLAGIETAKVRYPSIDFELIDFFDYNVPHDVLFIRGMSLQNSEIDSEAFKRLIDKLFDLANREVIYIERTTWPKLDPEYWCYKNPEKLYEYLGQYGKLTLKKYIKNTVFIRVVK